MADRPQAAGEKGGGVTGLSEPSQGREPTLPPWTRVVLARNPGPMTLEGTNTWVLESPGGNAIVVDPGPDDAEHLARVHGDRTIELVLLTHGHRDHSGGLDAMTRRTGAAARAWDPRHTTRADPLTDGERIEAGVLTVEVLHTPGHSADSVSFLVTGPDQTVLLTGDTLLGRGTAVIAHPDGRVAAYLRTLERLRHVGEIVVLPGHGPAGGTASAKASAYLRHRLQRLDQVRQATLDGARTAADVVAVVYPGLDDRLRPAALMTAQAHLDHLTQVDD